MSDQTPGEMPTTPAVQVTAPANEPPSQADGEQFDPARAMALIEKLRSQVKELTPKAKQAEQLAAAQKQKEEAEMTELQKLSKRLADAEAELSATKRTSLAATIAARVGLPAALADRLRGETPEEMEADAKAILEVIPKTQPTTKQPGPINPGVNAQAGETRAQKLSRLTGTSIDPFAKGAGINWPSGPSEG